MLDRLFSQDPVVAGRVGGDDRGMYVPAAEVAEGGDGALTYQGRTATRRAGKIGKSLKNSVSPDEMYERSGADTLRLYEMAMGPLDADRPWRTGDIAGVHRLLQRLWRAIVDERTGKTTVSDDALDDQALRRLHQTIAIVRRDFGAMRFNTAIARLIDSLPAPRGSRRATGAPRSLAESLVLMTAPLAPHIAEELWQRLGRPEVADLRAVPGGRRGTRRRADGQPTDPGQREDPVHHRGTRWRRGGGDREGHGPAPAVRAVHGRTDGSAAGHRPGPDSQHRRPVDRAGPARACLGNGSGALREFTLQSPALNSCVHPESAGMSWRTRRSR